MDILSREFLDEPVISSRMVDSYTFFRPRGTGMTIAELPLTDLDNDPESRGLDALRAWVDDIAALTQPDVVVWCDGSLAEADRLTKLLVAEGKLIRLNPEWRATSL